MGTGILASLWGSQRSPYVPQQSITSTRVSSMRTLRLPKHAVSPYIGTVSFLFTKEGLGTKGQWCGYLPLHPKKNNPRFPMPISRGKGCFCRGRIIAYVKDTLDLFTSQGLPLSREFKHLSYIVEMVHPSCFGRDGRGNHSNSSSFP